MKRIFILRGVPGAGKSTFVKNIGLKNYSLSLDDIRLMVSGLEYEIDGDYSIPQFYNGKVFNFFKEMLEMRMKKGSFTIYDATNTNVDSLRSLKKIIKKYGYTPYLVNFYEDLDVLLERNEGRTYKRVPKDVIKRKYWEMEESKDKIPSWLNQITPEEMIDMVKFYSVDLSHYKKVHHIGDIHSSYEPLEKYFKEGLKDDEFYIFIGDYLDRGTNPEDVIRFLLEIYEKKNVILLHGNHENHLINYANNKPYIKKSFETTREQITNIDKKDLRKLSKKFVQAYKYKYNDKTVICTHGGLPDMPENINLINQKNLINGVGNYNTNIDEIFTNNNLDNNIYQVHGHRNIFEIEIDKYEKSFNLEGKVEYGGDLRIITLSKDGFEPIYIKNNDYIIPDNKKVINSVKDMHDILSNEPNILVKKFDHILSFNYNDKVFREGIWNSKNIKARGLFINTDNWSIVSRGYDKMFNYRESSFRNKGEIINDDNIIQGLKYPLDVYLKENGFLGLLGYDETTDKLVFSSKSTIDKKHAILFKDIAYTRIGEEKLDKIKEELRDKNINLVFEVVDSVNDPHIVRYEKPDLILLDVIYREPKFKKLNFNELVAFSNKYNLRYKIKIKSLNNFNEFKSFYNKVNKPDHLYNNKVTEGYMIEDQENFTFKLKTNNYSFLKLCRKIVNNFDRYEFLYNQSNFFKNKDSHYLFKDDEYLNNAKDFMEFIINNKETYVNKNIPIFIIYDDFKQYRQYKRQYSQFKIF